MKKPKAILFDYGHTLIYETHFDLHLAGTAIYEVIENKEKVERGEFIEKTVKLYNDLSVARRKNALEVPATSFTRLLREYYGIEFSLSEVELQELYWNALSPPVPMDGVAELLQYLNDAGIKTGVISNLWYTGEVLKRRIERLIPSSHFEIFMSTADYGFRKPNSILFDIALKHIGIANDDAWFCGDEPEADIDGAFRAGLTPIMIEPGIHCPYRFKDLGKPECDCIKIRRLEEIRTLIESYDSISV